MAPKAALRPFQMASDCTADSLSRITAGSWRAQIVLILVSCSSISPGDPSTSTINKASTSVGYPALANRSQAMIAGPSMNSIATGNTPALIISETHAPATSLELKPSNMGRAPSGLRKIFNVASVTMPNCPSEPQITPRRSRPAGSRCPPPISMMSPFIKTIFTPSKLLVVTPYFKQWAPPEFIAILPAMAQANWLEGSGA